MSNNTNNTEMNNLAMEEEDEGEIFLGESDVLREIDVDEEDLPEADDDDMDDDGEQFGNRFTTSCFLNMKFYGC
jgi:hypothetical protein